VINERVMMWKQAFVAELAVGLLSRKLPGEIRKTRKFSTVIVGMSAQNGAGHLPNRTQKLFFELAYCVFLRLKKQNK
jgi:hypothetical protein